MTIISLPVLQTPEYKKSLKSKTVHVRMSGKIVFFTNDSVSLKICIMILLIKMTLQSLFKRTNSQVSNKMSLLHLMWLKCRIEV